MEFNQIKSITDMYKVFGFGKDPKKVIEVLQNIKLLKPCTQCTVCRDTTTLTNDPETKGGFAIFCSSCRKSVSITESTFFENSGASFFDIMQMLYAWAINLSIEVTADVFGLNEQLVEQCFHLARDICSWHSSTNMARKLGGPEMIVMVKEFVITKKIPQRWVVVLLDYINKRVIIEPVKWRDKETLILLIEQYVEIGSKIYTVECEQYNGLIISGCIHEAVNHKNQLASDLKVYSDTVDKVWSHAKTFLRRKDVLQNENLPEYIAEYLWRAEVKRCKLDKFFALIEHIKLRYPQ